MSGSNNLPVSYSHWKSNLSLIGSSSVAAAAAAAATGYQNIIKMSNQSATSPGHPGFMHQHHSPQLSEDHLIPAHSSHSPHSMSRIQFIGSPGSSTSLYSPGSNASSSAGCAMPTIIPRAHQQNMQPAPAHIQSSPSSFIDSQGHHIDIYSQIGMQRISQMYKATLTANNNNSNNCNNKMAKMNSIEKAEQSMNNIKQLVEGAIGHEAKQQIMHILEKISLLQPPERLLLYLRMPSSTSETDPLRQPQNPLGTRSEINFTINWVRSHLEMDPNVSIPKQDVYDEYVTYCAREDVKPLSTADFGKVMKQIFPSIRPRRLGTRGNSRYCYAAMRKTTKLECPQLPNLCDSKNTGESSGLDRLNAAIDDEDDEDAIGSMGSWKVIRIWAESLLNTEFKNANELAKHITANYLNGNSVAISNSSRAVLQKKLLQRKVKGRKKKSMSTSEQQELTEGKKRRKKKLKKSHSAQLDDNRSPGSASTTNDLNVPEMLKIKQEQKHLTDGPRSMESQHDLSPGTQQTVPINLTNEHGKLKNEIDLHGYSSNASNSVAIHDYASTVCKIEINEAADVEQAICCKKVRAAQESKGFAVPSPKMPQHSPDPRIPNLSPASMLMRPPLCDSSMIGTNGEPNDLSMNPESNSIESGASNSSNSNSLQLPNKRAAQNASGRVKRLRFHKHESVAGMNETKVDDISTDIIIPRERVVSICNMDKDALDDYLNEGGDSQEPEAELLQYFQPGKTSEKEKMPSNVTTDTVAGNTATIVSVTESAPTTQAFPLLENYELHQQNIASNAATMASEAQRMAPNAAATPKQINALRQYLQQNLHQSSAGVPNSSVSSAAAIDDGIVSSTDAQSNSIQMPNNSLNTTNSLTALSMPYQQSTDNSTSQPQTVANLMDRMIEMQKSHPPPLIRSTSTSSHIDQSPNSRCNKNCSFVPISPRPQSPRIQSNQTLPANVQPLHGRNTFLSPRQSPAIRKTVAINRDLTNCLKQLQDPSISTYDIGYIAKNEISASAPASPSITPHHFQFNKAHGSGYGGPLLSSSSAGRGHQQSQHQHHSQSHQHQATCSISGMCPVLERSQSVPLHCQSPAFNAPPISSTAYNSVCNSVAPTPVPSEFADFNEDNLLDMLTETSTSNEKNTSIKIETNEPPNMMSNHNRNIISRSVPSTPLPMNAYQMNAINNFGNVTATSPSNSIGLLMTCKTSASTFDASKSVPTTPNPLATNNTPSFRYSPERSSRDFPLNSNVVDVTKSTQFYPVAQASSRHTSPQQQASQGIQQHPSISSTQSNGHILLANTTQSMDNNNLSHYNDVGDRIIAGSDLMNDIRGSDGERGTQFENEWN